MRNVVERRIVSDQVLVGDQRQSVTKVVVLEMIAGLFLLPAARNHRTGTVTALLTPAHFTPCTLQCAFYSCLCAQSCVKISR